MLKKSMTSTSGIFLLAILALASLGVVYGLWSKNLVINGTVTTGDLNADWDCAYTNDDGVQTTNCPDAADNEAAGDTGADPHGSFPPFPYSVNFVEKDVAECTVTIGGAGTAFGAQVATVEIVNGYPSYECEITLALSNTGSIPFNYTGAAVSTSGNIELLDGACSLLDVGTQIDPGEDELISCTVHVLQTAEQNECTGTTTTPGGLVTVEEDCTNDPLVTYTFDLKVCVAQWNEEATYAECIASPQHEGPQ